MTRMSEAVEHVREQFELGESEAALYVHLCVAGPSKVSDLSEALKVHRNEVYRTAERLEARGLIRANDDRPARFVAIDPEAAYDVELVGRLKAVEDLRRSREEITSLLTQLQPHVERSPAKSTYKVIKGRREIYRLRRQLIDSAQNAVDWTCSFAPGVEIFERSGERDAMQARAMAGVQVRALVPASEGSRKALAPLANEKLGEARAIDTPGIVRFLIVDDRELLMFVVNDGSSSIHAEDEVALHTTAPGFIHAQRLFFDQMWAAAPPLFAEGGAQ